MAGLSSRFFDAGFGAPKFMLDVRGRPIFDWALSSLQSFIDAGWGFTFVMRSDHAVERFVRSRARSLGVEVDALVRVRESTRGQAESAMLGAAAADASESTPLVIFNVDTHVAPTSLEAREVQESDGWIPCFPGNGSSWSFVSLDDVGRAVDVAEKQRISGWASVGLYGFRSKALFEDAFFRHENRVSQSSEELFVAPLYKALLEDNRPVHAPKLEREKVVPLGTPSEVNAFDRAFSPPGVVHAY